MTIMAAAGAENNRNGSGSYTPLKRKKQEDKKKDIQDELELLDKKDLRMRFKNSKDPVIVAFEFLEKQPLKKLAADFIKDSISDVICFISKFN